LKTGTATPVPTICSWPSTPVSKLPGTCYYP